MIASSKGLNSIVQLLLEYEADVNIRDKYYQTALILASKTSQISTIELLSIFGAYK